MARSCCGEAADTVGLFDEDSSCSARRRIGSTASAAEGAFNVHAESARGRGDDEEELGSDVPRAGARHIRFPDKHRGRREAERARRLLLVSLRLRGWVFPGQRGRTYADTARWLAGSSVEELLGG
jgi:hypothetical protein